MTDFKTKDEIIELFHSLRRERDSAIRQLGIAQRALSDECKRNDKITEEVLCLRKRVGLSEPSPVPMLLVCPACGERHVDEGEFATKPHHTHACQHCGTCWRPAIVNTVGVQFLPGFKNP